MAGPQRVAFGASVVPSPAVVYADLRSGSDVRAVAMENPDCYSVVLTPEVAKNVACAFGIWLGRQQSCDVLDLTIAVGRDPRLSGESIQGAIALGLSEMGSHVFNCGMASTPAMFETTQTNPINADGAIEITASHHPWHLNGMKLIRRGGGLSSTELKEVLAIAQELTPAPAVSQGEITSIDFMDIYASQLREKIKAGVVGAADPDHPLDGLKIAVDASHGVSGFFADLVLAPFGADVSGSQFLDPNGMFPDHAPNPEDNAAMESIRRKVHEVSADLGVIFDTDGDRVGLVEKGGQSLGSNRLVALAAAVVLKKHPGSWIVTDSIVSPHTIAFIESLGGRVDVHKRGYNNVIQRGRELDRDKQPEGCYLAIECSGHAALKDNHWLDDGAYLAVQLIIEAANMRAERQTLGDLIANLKEPAEKREIRMAISGAEYGTIGQSVIEELRQFAGSQGSWEVVPVGAEGIRIHVPEGCIVLRPSVHDPLLVLNVESDVPEGCAPILAALKEFFSRYDRLNLSKFAAAQAS